MAKTHKAEAMVGMVCAPIVPALARQRQENYHEFEAIIGQIETLTKTKQNRLQHLTTGKEFLHHLPISDPTLHQGGGERDIRCQMLTTGTKRN